MHNFVHLNLSVALLLGYTTFLAGIETATENDVSSLLPSCTGYFIHVSRLPVLLWLSCYTTSSLLCLPG